MTCDGLAVCAQDIAVFARTRCRFTSVRPHARSVVMTQCRRRIGSNRPSVDSVPIRNRCRKSGVRDGRGFFRRACWRIPVDPGVTQQACALYWVGLNRFAVTARAKIADIVVARIRAVGRLMEALPSGEFFSRCEVNLTFPKGCRTRCSSQHPLPTPHATSERRFSPTGFIRRHALPCLRSASPRRQINAIR